LTTRIKGSRSKCIRITQESEENLSPKVTKIRRKKRGGEDLIGFEINFANLETYMGDMVMIRGLDVDRSKNLS